jgi:alpha-beta hydrolase superfamily lysophospholipase
LQHEARFLDDGGPRLYWQTWRPDATPRATIVLMPGQGDHGGRYAQFGEMLAQAGYAVGAIDMRGNGRSDGRRGDTPSYDAVLDDLGAAVREARRTDPDCEIFLFGHSTGGQLVANYVVRRLPSIGGAILCSPWFVLALHLPRWKVIFGRSLARIYPTYTFPNTIKSSQLTRDADHRQAADPDHLAHGRVTARMAAALIDGGHAALLDAPRFDLPLLLLQAGMDTVVDPRAADRFAKQVGTADCTFHVYPDSRHELLHDVYRDEVTAEIIAWLDGHI